MARDLLAGLTPSKKPPRDLLAGMNGQQQIQPTIQTPSAMPKQPTPTLKGFGKNVLEELSGIGEQMNPAMAAFRAGQQGLETYKQLRGKPIGERAGIVGGMLAEQGKALVKPYLHPIQSAYEQPITTALAWIPVGMKGAKIAGKTSAGTSALMKNSAGRLINSIIKPLKKDFAYGKNAGEGVVREGIIAKSFDDLMGKISVKVNEIGNKISETIKKPQNNTKIIDNTGIIINIDEAIAQANKSPKTNSALLTRLENAKSDILGIKEVAPGEFVITRNLQKMSPIDTFELKKQVADITKWTGNASDDALVNKALKRTYGQLKENLNNAVPELKNLNERYANIKTADMAIQYRNKILQRQNALGLFPKLSIGGGILASAASGNLSGLAGGALIAGGEMLARSTPFKTGLARGLYKTGRGIEKVTAGIKNIPNPVLTLEDLKKNLQILKNQKGAINPSGDIKPVGMPKQPMPKEGGEIVYHATNKEFNEFQLPKTTQAGQAKAIFFSDTPEGTKYYQRGENSKIIKAKISPEAKIFDFRNPNHIKLIDEFVDSSVTNNPEWNSSLKRLLKSGGWGDIERPEFQKFLKTNGFDGFKSKDLTGEITTGITNHKMVSKIFPNMPKQPMPKEGGIEPKNVNWNKVNSFLKRKGYDVRGADDVKGIYSRITNNWNKKPTGDHLEALDYASTKKIQSEQTKAARYFGYTNDLKMAGYMTPEGKLLDFSGRKQGAYNPQTRQMDHREINQVLDYDINPELKVMVKGNEHSNSIGMRYFMNKGNIRMQQTGIDLSVKPTEKQLPLIKEHIMNNLGDSFYVDISDKQGNTIKSFSYEYPNIKIANILNDINNSFAR